MKRKLIDEILEHKKITLIRSETEGLRWRMSEQHLSYEKGRETTRHRPIWVQNLRGTPTAKASVFVCNQLVNKLW